MDELGNIGTIEHKKLPFARIGWALFALLGISTAVQLLADAAANLWAPQLSNSSWFSWVLTVVPLYLIAAPLAYLIIKPLPKLSAPMQKISFGKLLSYIAMSYAIMYLGNLIGTLFNLGISEVKGQELTNPLTGMLTDSNIFLEILVVAIIAPIMEELVFRKILLDRIRVYGEGLAILVSGLTFGLFHGNLFQFFYAFALGSFFAYVYLRTGRVQYTMLMHLFINLFSVIQAQFVLNVLDSDMMEKLSGGNPEEIAIILEQSLPQLIGVMLISLIVVVLLISGVVLLISNRKKAVLFDTPEKLPKGERFKNVFVNWGMGLFFLLSVGMMVLIAIVL